MASVLDINEEAPNGSTDADLKRSSNAPLVATSLQNILWVVQNDETTRESAQDGSLVEVDEPYVGQEFDTEVDAQAFYNVYGLRMGFNTRMNYLSRSKHDGTVVARTFVCSKEGYRKPDRRDKKTLNPRAPTRVGCMAMLSIKKLNPQKWVVSKFIKEHNHTLIPSKRQKGLVEDQIPDDKTKIEELSRELFLERERSASLRKVIDLLFEHIEEHTQDLSKKVQYVVDKVKEIESEGKKPS
ncbi:protein FAR1-RELATED SEQUENCE 12-like [Argentina anserina]|uniref:protein FAR1-RELATED SEQUENCE 12-like n=1 Tax=Argentina anserina TaxID=57926 RepID=UPI0021763284|nr:protein FAR1-RELATED SEQUENCE 12-like [Potentilla anserina]